MKAISQNEFGDIDVLEEVEIPVPKPGREEVLVEIHAIGFNPVDVKMRIGLYPQSFPMTLGVDFSGIVVGKGDMVRDFEVGDRVFGLVTAQASNGSYAQFTCVPQQMIAKIPKSLTFEAAAVVPVAYLTAYEAMIGHGVFEENRPLFIAGGSGGVGSAAIALAGAYRLGPIFTLAGSSESVNYLESKFGIPEKQIVRYQGISIEETSEQLVQKNGGDRFYMTLDFVGRKSKELCFDIVAPRGHVITILPEEEHFPIPVWGRGDGPIWRKSLSLHMVFLFAASLSKNQKDWMFYKSVLTHLSMLLETDQIPAPIFKNVGEFSVETARKAHLQLEEGHTKGKLVMSVAHSRGE